ncbi:LysR substrate-binding domain-containing protein [Brucella cytisi]|uniref:HTH lysR-type domain-containing protein n=1 Tax=Brucella cytisi TaxID=407152 RepID=A0A1J6HL45_9HYPH|nr:LysR substrate-binding domain-containing protein [Brucella cytisi]OIS93652.1 hypothetical protein BLA27_10090 [Brucella cytisi]
MRNLNSLPLSALRTIEAIGRTGTLAAAACELGVTSGALSQRLAKAEIVLGQSLFVRSSYGLEPTEKCRAVLPRLTEAVLALSEVVTELRDPDEASLSITMAPDFATHWFVRRATHFLELNPDISIRVDPNRSIIDLDTESWDVGIRLCTADLAGNAAEKLLDEILFPVCTPKIAERLCTPTDIRSVPIIRDQNWLRGWHPWLSACDMDLSDLPNGPIYTLGSLCLKAAITGQGVFMAWETLACDALADKRLMLPFEQRILTNEAYWFVTSRAAARKPCVARFREWLKFELDKSIISRRLIMN